MRKWEERGKPSPKRNGKLAEKIDFDLLDPGRFFPVGTDLRAACSCYESPHEKLSLRSATISSAGHAPTARLSASPQAQDGRSCRHLQISQPQFARLSTLLKCRPFQPSKMTGRPRCLPRLKKTSCACRLQPDVLACLVLRYELARAPAVRLESHE